MLRRIIITDRPELSTRVADVVVWLGRGHAPACSSGGGFVVRPSSLHSAALFLAAEGAAEVRLDLRDPMAFVRKLQRVEAEPVLRAA